MLGSFDRFTTEDLDINDNQHRKLARAVQAWRSHLTNPPPPKRSDPTGGLSL